MEKYGKSYINSISIYNGANKHCLYQEEVVHMYWYKDINFMYTYI